jgi:acetyl-CoA carboxylase carboxyl transferase subunit beta
MTWFRKPQYTVLKAPQLKDRIPDGLWYKCESCLNILYIKDFEQNLKVCPRCNFHARLSADERIAMLADNGTFKEMETNVVATDPLKFVDSKPYPDRLEAAQKSSNLTEAIKTGLARVNGYEVVLGVMDFGFIGGSMGSVVGEMVTRVFETALDKKLPVVMVCTSGGARMQEGILSLMQMAKTSIAVARMGEARLPYISVLTNPTTAGVMASYASLGDVIVAEPKALIGFAGPRVIQQTINQILPKGFQRSEFVLEHGFIDVVVNRRDLKKVLTNLLSYFCLDQNARLKGKAGKAADVIEVI